MKREKIYSDIRKRRAKRVRAKISGTKVTPRVAVFRSLRHISAQFIDDAAQKTVLSVHDSMLKDKDLKPVEKARALGNLAAVKAADLKLQNIVFDRRHYRYHGRVKAFADGMREKGLQF
ncbi:MAG: 50S ribosomal protein L18 [Parcubacteria group bacterium]|nr:50S ribosomal protein L18 [Parcubacteria group bacterium]